MSGISNCVRCKKPLIEKKCLICGGNGKVGRGLNLKTCPICGGRGKMLTCPDATAHFVEDYKRRKHPRTIVPDLTRKFKVPPPGYKPKKNETIMDLLRKYKVPPPSQNVPPWDIRYEFPWHPHHPRNPNRLRAFQENARRAAEQARKKRLFRTY